MNKKLLLQQVLVLFFTFLISPVFSQNKDWMLMMQDPNVNFREAQEAFDTYWKNRDDYKGNGYKLFKRWTYINENRIQPDGKLLSSEYVLNTYNKYMSEHGLNQAMNKSASGTWSLVGPNSFPINNTGQPTGVGRISEIAFHPTDPNTIYVGTPNGGVWKTTNNGGFWGNISANIPYLGVSSILVHPTDPNIIYIGTGDRDGGNAPGLGVYKTTDGGSSWEQINNGMGNTTVGMMLMHPTDPNIIIAATQNGIYRTINGGVTWALRVTGSFKDIKFKPGDPNILYGVKITTPSELYRSSDNGITWLPITSGVPSVGIGSRMVLGVTAANPEYVYLLQIKDLDNTFANLLRSTDSGLSFSTQSTGPNILGYNCDGSGTASQATYDLCMVADPNNADIIYVGGINTWKSTNGGTSWNIATHWSSDCGVGLTEVHADHHVLKFSPLNGNLYLGSDGGVQSSTNGGTSWNELSSNLAISQAYKLGQSTHNQNIMVSGYQDNGCAASNGGTFTTVSGGDGGECMVDFSDANYAYNTYVEGVIRRSTTGAFGSYQTMVANGSYGFTEDGAWITPYRLDHSNSNTMFVGLKNIWRTNNVKAASRSSIVWEKISDFVDPDPTIRIIEQSPVNANIVYIARQLYGWSLPEVYISENSKDAAAAVVWNPINLPGNVMPSDIKAHPTDENIVFATSGKKVYRSANKGNTWTDISLDLPQLDINCLVLDKNANEGIYIGNILGVWYKDATLSNWLWYSYGLPPVDIRELEIYYDNANPENNRIKAATYGRGLWTSELIEINTLNPSNFGAIAYSSNQIDLTWSKNAANDNVLIATSPTTIFGSPTKGTAYSVGNTLPGGGTVIYVGNLDNFSHTGLTAGTNYCYKIWSVNNANQYSAGLIPICTQTLSQNWTGSAANNDWFDPANWGNNQVPTSEIGVFIPGGLASYPIINATGAACKSITIASGASLSMSAATAYTLQVAGDWTNDGTFTAGIGTVSFNGTNALQVIKGSSTTAFYFLNVNKQSIQNILEVKSLITLNASTNPLSISAGTFKLSSASVLTPFTNASGADLSSLKGFWNNGGTINPGNFSWSVNGGKLQSTAGIINIGNAAGNSIIYLNNPSIILEGGIINIAGRFAPNSGTSSSTIIISGGVLNVCTVGSTNTTRGAFELSVNANFTMSGGQIVVHKRTSHTSADIIMFSTTSNITGGTIQAGGYATPATLQTIRINSTLPFYNFTVNTLNAPIARLVINPLNVLNNVTIMTGGTLDANDVNMTLGGNWINHGTFLPRSGTVTINGTVSQNIEGSVATTFNNLTLNKSVNTQLVGVDATVTGVLNLTLGTLNTGSNMLILADNATKMGGDNTAYIEGWCRKVGNDAFTFPLGKNGVYAPIGISAPGDVNDHFTATYFASNPHPTYDQNALQAPLHHVSTKEYWMLNRTNGASNVSVTASWDETRSGEISQISDLQVARWDGTQWVSEGNATNSGNTITGTITSNVVTSFSPFTLGSTTIQNTFPIELLYFNAKVENNTTVGLEWVTLSETNNNFFTVERSQDRSQWQEIMKVQSQGNGNQPYTYKHTDAFPHKGVSYYRLKQTNLDGSSTYSDIQSVNISTLAANEVKLYPNPFNQSLSIEADKKELDALRVFSIEGKDLTPMIPIIIRENNKLMLDMRNLNEGIYMIQTATGVHMLQKQ